MSRQQKTFLILLRFTIAIVAISFMIWGIILITQDELIFGSFAIIAAILILLGGLYYTNSQQKILVKGEVIQDERSIQFIYQAGYYSFVGSFLIWTIILGFIDEFQPPRFLIYLGLLGELVIFLISYFVIKTNAQS